LLAAEVVVAQDLQALGGLKVAAAVRFQANQTFQLHPQPFQ
jgi:hypothetical protein